MIPDQLAGKAAHLSQEPCPSIDVHTCGAHALLLMCTRTCGAPQLVLAYKQLISLASLAKLSRKDKQSNFHTCYPCWRWAFSLYTERA